MIVWRDTRYGGMNGEALSGHVQFHIEWKTTGEYKLTARSAETMDWQKAFATADKAKEAAERWLQAKVSQ